MITKTERVELRSVVRGQLKVLRAEIEQRKAELLAEMENRIADRYRDVDEQQQALMWKAHEICEAASREITDLFVGQQAERGLHDDREISVQQPIRVRMEPIEWSKRDRVQLRRAMVAAIEAQIEGALLNLQRQEADLLRTLAVGAIESEEAKAFLTGIPSVAELVPSARLAELEAQFINEQGDSDG